VTTTTATRHCCDKGDKDQITQVEILVLVPCDFSGGDFLLFFRKYKNSTFPRIPRLPGETAHHARKLAMADNFDDGLVLWSVRVFSPSHSHSPPKKMMRATRKNWNPAVLRTELAPSVCLRRMLAWMEEEGLFSFVFASHLCCLTISSIWFRDQI
jgi:hypothetical protein